MSGSDRVKFKWRNTFQKQCCCKLRNTEKNFGVNKRYWKTNGSKNYRNLFEFNLDKKFVIIKNNNKRYIKKNYTIKLNRILIPTKPNNKASKKINLHENEKINQTTDKLNENILNKSKVENSLNDNITSKKYWV